MDLTVLYFGDHHITYFSNVNDLFIAFVETIPHNVVMPKIQIIGTSGAGKTTLAEACAQVFDIPHIELDGIHWQNGWVELDRAEMKARVASLLAQNPHWVVDGNYSQVFDLVQSQANLIIWPDLPKYQTLWAVTRRSIIRGLTRARLWKTENRESLLKFFFSKDSMFYWVWTTHDRRHQKFGEVFKRLTQINDGPLLVRLKSRRETKIFRDTLLRRRHKGLVHKALAYVVRGSGNQAQLLVFEHPRTKNVEVVRGTVDQGESSRQTAERELFEEAGLSLPVKKRLGFESVFVRSGPFRQGPLEHQLYDCFLFDGSGIGKEEWTHQVSGDGGDEGMKFRFFWIPLASAQKKLTPETAKIIGSKALSDWGA